MMWKHPGQRLEYRRRSEQVAPDEHAVAQCAGGHDGMTDDDADQRHDADDVDRPVTVAGVLASTSAGLGKSAMPQR